jgi:hypothetical protein
MRISTQRLPSVGYELNFRMCIKELWKLVAGFPQTGLPKTNAKLTYQTRVTLNLIEKCFNAWEFYNRAR